MVIIRKKKFVRAEYVCRKCGARPGGNPETERTICSCWLDGINGEYAEECERAADDMELFLILEDDEG